MASAPPPRDLRCVTSTAPWTMLVLCWGLALGMGALVGRELHADAERNHAFGEGPRWRVGATAALARLGEATGLARLRAVIEARKRDFYEAELTVGGRQAPPAGPAPAAVAGPAGPESVAAPGPDAGPDEPESVAAPGPDAVLDEPESVAPAAVVRRVMVVGASSIQTDLGRALERRIEDDLGVEVLRHGRHSTGMARPDYFDWNARALELNADFRPDLVIAQFGGNDGQGLTDRDTGRAVAPFFTDDWDAVYGARLETFVDLFSDDAVPVVILGMPAMRNAYHQSKMARINAVTRAACERAGAHFVDTFAMTADAAGNPLTRAEVDGRPRIVHAADGMHLSRYGSDMVAAGVVDTLDGLFEFAPPAETVSDGGAPATVPGGGASVAKAPAPDASRPPADGPSSRPPAQSGGRAAEAALELDQEARWVIQRGLRERGFDPGPLDGIVGPRTRTALRRWQTAQGLPATGYLDESAARALSGR